VAKLERRRSMEVARMRVIPIIYMPMIPQAAFAMLACHKVPD
jgi:acyl-coenzyme A synthetase/AMP-(fatty) acid ligase